MASAAQGALIVAETLLATDISCGPTRSGWICRRVGLHSCTPCGLAPCSKCISMTDQPSLPQLSPCPTRYADYRFPELHRLRDRVVLAAAQVLGALSPLRLDSLTTRFLKEARCGLTCWNGIDLRGRCWGLCHHCGWIARLHAGTLSK